MCKISTFKQDFITFAKAISSDDESLKILLFELKLLKRVRLVCKTFTVLTKNLSSKNLVRRDWFRKEEKPPYELIRMIRFF